MLDNFFINFFLILFIYILFLDFILGLFKLSFIYLVWEYVDKLFIWCIIVVFLLGYLKEFILICNIFIFELIFKNI